MFKVTFVAAMAMAVFSSCSSSGKDGLKDIMSLPVYSMENMVQYNHPELITGNPWEFHRVGDNFFVFNGMPTSAALVFRMSDCHFLGEFMLKGMGPGECLTPRYAGCSKGEDTVYMYDTGKSVINKTLLQNCADVKGKATITGKFNGATLGMLFNIKGGDKEFSLRYQIDGGEWQDFGVNSKKWSFQQYAHAQAFMFAHNLSDGEHTIKIEFEDGSETYFGGLLVNGK